jgi:SAM-dependent methyltransferase
VPEPGGVEAFYDRLADHYHLLFADWRSGGVWQAGVLLPLLEAAAGGSVRTLLDVTCGIGTQAIPLAELGLSVRGRDLSPRAIERARSEAAAAGVSVDFAVGDVLRLSEPEADAVVSLDNALPHLLDDGDLARALASMTACARPGGAVAASVRDYDTQVSPEAVRVLGEPPRRTAIATLWDWQPDSAVYRLDHLVLAEEGGWSLVTAGSVRFRAYKRAELVAAFTAAGLRDVRWLAPEESGYYQPLVVGTRP